LAQRLQTDAEQKESRMTVETSTPTVFNSDSLAPTALGAGERSQTLPSASVARRVLVLEDDPALRDLIADLFAFEGYFVTEAADEESMLRSVSFANDSVDEHFDLVVLGLQVKGILGIDTLVRLRDSGCGTPAIVLAAQPKALVAQQFNDLDALFLEKPFALENLRIVANHVVHARKCGFGQLA
jgi:CheY-like chemotaxis protein